MKFTVELPDEVLIELFKKVIAESQVHNNSGKNLSVEADELLTRQQAAEFLSVTPQTLNTWVKTNQLKCLRQCGRVYFSKRDLWNAVRKGK
jgi:hypothetical protein